MHSSEAEILLYLEDKLNPGNVRRMIEHFSDCQRCREQLVMLLRLPVILDSVEVPGIDDRVLAKARELVVPTRGGAARLFRSPLAHLTLAGVLAAAGIAFLLVGRSPEPERFRDRSPVRHSFSVHPPEGGSLRDFPARLSWSPVKRSVGYTVSLYRENGTLLWQGNSTDTTSIIPPDVVLEPGRTYLWRVESFLPDRSTYESSLNAFQYSP